MYVACGDLATAGLCGIRFKWGGRATALENAVMSFKTAYEVKMRRKPRLRQHGPSVATNRKNLARFDPMVPI
jgi:hypothetical protein